jgi:hypothetical protein
LLAPDGGPLLGKQSDWSTDRPVTAEGLIAALDEAGVDETAIVQASTCHGYDNSYCATRLPDFRIDFRRWNL